MSGTNRISWEILRSFNTATISSAATFYNVGTPLLYPSYKLKMVNNSNILLVVSIDGINAVDVCPGTSYWLYDETQAQINSSNSPAVPAGTQISVNYPAYVATPGVGLVYLVSQYQVQG